MKVKSSRAPSKFMGARRVWTSVGAFAVAAAVLSGCTQQESLDRSDAVADLDYDRERIVFPIDRFVMSERDVAAVEQANSFLLERCMAESGLAFPQAEFDLTSEAPLPIRTYGIWSLESAANFGYELPASPIREQIAQANRAQNAEWGQQAQRCLTETELLPVYSLNLLANEDTMKFLAPVQRIAEVAYQAASADPEWTAARTDWWACMERAGLSPRRAPSAWSPEVPSDEEGMIRTAIADVQCKLDTNMVARLANIEASYQGTLVEQNESLLRSIAEASSSVVAEAEAILAGRA